MNLIFREPTSEANPSSNSLEIAPCVNGWLFVAAIGETGPCMSLRLTRAGAARLGAFLAGATLDELGPERSGIHYTLEP